MSAPQRWRRVGVGAALLAASVLGLPASVAAAETAADSTGDAANESSPNVFHGREYLHPELATEPFALEDGPRPYLSRVSFTPGAGTLSNDRQFTLRAAFNPNSWLGWEAGVSHVQGESVHALLHTLGGLVRYPLPWRAQPYGRLGYGMLMVFPGESLKADPVTENALVAGGGLEFFLRDDVALRAEGSSVTVIGGERDSESTVAYQYTEMFFALSFYRGLSR